MVNAKKEMPTNIDQDQSTTELLNIFAGKYAHSLKDQPVEVWQPLFSHLQQVAKYAAEFCHPFESSDWGWNAGMLHDIGKASRVFQAYLRRVNEVNDENYDGVDKGKVNHSSAGAALAEEVLNRQHKKFGRILSYLVAGHHAGLPDYETFSAGRGALKVRLQEGQADLKKIQKDAETIQSVLHPLEKLPSFVNKRNLHFWMRLLFSALVDADYLDTESFMNPEKNLARGGAIALQDLKSALDKHLDQMAQRSEMTPVNVIRNEILRACRSAAHLESGLFSLTVPTGGGKTLSGMAFALDHALHHGKQRIIYVIPYTSIIEQTAEILGDIFGSENVVEHHSNLDPSRESLRSQLAAENWDAPIIVTTNVQFFESLYAAKPSRCRKLHNLINSVVILDEAQLVPPNLLIPCTAVIEELTSNYGVTLVLSTATQPALPGLDPHEIIPDHFNLYQRLQRNHIILPEKNEERMSWESLASRLNDHDQVLCIVNTRRDCFDLYQLMAEGTVHLSALMCGEHRSQIIKEIKEKLRLGKPIRVVSTQLVEAGVDIDFPIVYRAMAGLDSIAQAAGRCNREGKLDEGRVVVFNPPKSAPPGLQHKGESTTLELAALADFNPQDSTSFTRYFSLFYSKITDRGENLLSELTPDPSTLEISFRSVAESFNLIDDKYQRPVFVRYGKGELLLKELAHSGPNRGLLRKLQRFTVNLPTKYADRMLRDGLLEEVWPGFLAQCSLAIYNESVGLDIFSETLPIDDLIL